MMTLDEAIKHCDEVAEKNECIAHSLTKDGWQEHFNNLTQEKEAEYKNVREEMANSCLECASEHRQLASWLKALKEIWDSGDCNDCKFSGHCEIQPKLGQLVRFNCYHFSREYEEVNTDED